MPFISEIFPILASQSDKVYTANTPNTNAQNIQS